MSEKLYCWCGGRKKPMKYHKSQKWYKCVVCKARIELDREMPVSRTYDTSIQRLMDVFREPTTDEPKEEDNDEL